jgi:hypothetical protein
MTAIASQSDAAAPLTRRARAARTVAAALKGGIIGAAVAAGAWLLAGAIASTAFVLLIVASIGLAGWTLLRDGKVPTGVWLVLGIAWAVVMIERWAVQAHGGLWVAAAAWLGVILAARRAGISKWALPLLAYPLISAAIVVLADQPLDDPWGSSWLWILAVLGPVVGARTLLNPSERKHPE